MTNNPNQETVSGGKILIVEDEPELLAPLEYSLRKAGFTTHSAADGLNACRMVGSWRPDLILLDIMLPDLDGWEVCRMIRRHPEETVASIPIMMMTALGNAENRYKGLELGADAYLAKPYAMKEVILQARNLVARQRQQGRLRQQVTEWRQGEQCQIDLQDMIFHELRNHLLVVGGFSEVLTRGSSQLNQEKNRGYLEAIRRSSSYLAKLADEFLLLRRVEEKRLELPRQAIDPGILLVEMTQMFKPVAADQGIELKLEVPGTLETVLINDAGLRVILANLLGNAIRYSQAGTRVSLGFRLDQQNTYCFEVLDQGPGIAAAEQKSIFERFKRGAAREGNSQGSGLGLYIAKTLVEAMNGRIELSSRPGDGSCFRVLLPAGVDNCGAPQAEAPKPGYSS